MKLERLLALFLLAFLVGCGSSSSNSPSPSVPAGDFAISISPQSVFLPIGVSSASFQLSITPVSSFSQLVAISMTGLPTGVTATPSLPINVSPGTSQTVTLNAATGVHPGQLQVSIQATSGVITHTAPLAMSVAKPVYAYVSDDNSVNNIVGYSVDANTGAMTKLSAPVAPPSQGMTSPVLVANANGGTFLFMNTQTGSAQNPQNHLVSFRVDGATGSWIPIEDRLAPQSTWEGVIGVHPSGKFLYTQIWDQQAGQYCIAAYLIDPATGYLTRSWCSANSPFLASVGPMSIPPPGNFGYLNAPGSAPGDSVQGYAINPTDGSLMPLSTTPLISSAFVYATDPLGRAIYVLPSGTFPCTPLQSWGIDSNSGLLNPLGSINSDATCIYWLISISTDGKYAYYGALKQYLEMPTIYTLPLDPTTGNLVFNGTVANVPDNGTANYTDMIFEPSQGRFVIVVNRLIGANSSSSDLSSVPYDPGTGNLGTPVVSVPIPYGSLVAVVASNQ